MAGYVAKAEQIEIPDDLLAANAFLEEKGWTDGLPVIPPTEPQVARMLAGTTRDPQEEVGVVHLQRGRVAEGDPLALVQCVRVAGHRIDDGDQPGEGPSTASGPTSAAMMPVSARSSGPLTRKQRHGAFTVAVLGAWLAGQMIEISYSVQVTETMPLPPSSPAGTAALGSSRQTA